ncbi:MAG: hypothetical protein ACW985_01990, partial [Candidatus Thorarchaeota archaeon]
LETVDLGPLAKCIRLEDLNMLGNKIGLLDVSSLFSCASLHTLSLMDDTKLVSWMEPNIEILNPPALNALTEKGQIEFL